MTWQGKTTLSDAAFKSNFVNFNELNLARPKCASTIKYNKTKKNLLFPEMRVTRKIFTRAAGNLNFLIHFPKIFVFSFLASFAFFLYYCFVLLFFCLLTFFCIIALFCFFLLVCLFCIIALFCYFFACLFFFVSLLCLAIFLLVFFFLYYCFVLLFFC